MLYAWIAVGLLAGGVAGGVAWRRSRRARAETRRRLAMREFADGGDAITAQFRERAAALGKPRGLAWEACEFSGEPVFARDATSGELIALSRVTIRFSAIEGGGMEDVEAVGNLRCATAVFVHRSEGWTTEGRTIFNLEPAEALARFRDVLIPMGFS